MILDLSDYFAVFVSLMNDKIPKTSKGPLEFEYRDVNDVALSSIKSLLNDTNWQFDENMTADEMFDIITTKVNEYVDTSAPLQVVSIPSHKVIREKWMTKDISKSTNKLHNLRLNTIQVRQFRNAHNRSVRLAKSSYYGNLLRDYKYDMVKTWRLLNKLTGKGNVRSTLPEYFNVNGVSN